MLRRGWSALILFCTAVLVSGCATERPQLVLDPIGPISGGPLAFLGLSKGFLQVFSATYPMNSGGIVYQPHTSYSVYSFEGKHLWGVVNHVGQDDNRPMMIEIPPGFYFVYAISDRFGQVKVPVFVVGNKTTMVYLEGVGMPHAESLPESELVRLPDGRVAGRRAEDRETQKKK
jgi:hypothetical protein